MAAAISSPFACRINLAEYWQPHVHIGLATCRLVQHFRNFYKGLINKRERNSDDYLPRTVVVIAIIPSLSRGTPTARFLKSCPSHGGSGAAFGPSVILFSLFGNVQPCMGRSRNDQRRISRMEVLVEIHRQIYQHTEYLRAAARLYHRFTGYSNCQPAWQEPSKEIQDQLIWWLQRPSSRNVSISLHRIRECGAGFTLLPV